MKKWFLWLSSTIILVAILAVLTYEKVEIYSNFTKVEVNKNPYNFNTISNNDSITHIFKLRNITNTLLVIEKVLPSCPCTQVSFDKKKWLKNEVVSITAKFKPTKNQKGDVKTVIFVQCNAEKGIVKLELNGKIKNN
jgi:hypothetical protein